MQPSLAWTVGHCRLNFYLSRLHQPKQKEKSDCYSSVIAVHHTVDLQIFFIIDLDAIIFHH